MAPRKKVTEQVKEVVAETVDVVTKPSITAGDVLDMYNILEFAINKSKEVIPVDAMGDVGAVLNRFKSLKEAVEAETDVSISMDDLKKFIAVVSNLVLSKPVFGIQDFSFVGGLFDKVHIIINDKPETTETTE